MKPVIRFAEFGDEWKAFRLGEIAEKVIYGMNSPAKQFDGVHKYLRITDIDEETRVFKPNPLCSPTGEIDKKYILQKNDLVIARTGASVGKSYLYNPDDGVLCFAGYLIKFSIKNANPFFVYCQTLRENYKNWLITMSMRSGQPGVNAEEYKSFEINIPSLAEQEKIGNFLSLIDQKIQGTEKLLQDWKNYKKALLQQIFSQQIRFQDPHGKDFEDWKVFRLGDLGKFYAGGDLEKLDYKKEKTSTHIYPVYANGSGEGLYGYATTFQFPPNCVTVSGRGNLGFANVRKENFNAIVRLIVIIPIKEIYPKFLEESINQINFFVESTGVPQLTVPQISKYEIQVPSLAEQEKIGNFLSLIDQKIQGIEKLLQYWKNYKKALLQVMFV